MSKFAGRDDFIKTLNVSRETLAGFDQWHALLCKWSQKINLVAPSTLPEFWTRHAQDSAQFAKWVPAGARRGIDLGSGAGFPGLAIALMRMNDNPIHMVLVESNAKKAAFLRTCIQETGAPAEVVCERAESLQNEAFDIITARALAPLDQLLGLSEPFAGPQTVRLFAKGAGVQKEIEQARKHWTFCYEPIPSITEHRATILKIEEAIRV
jgi:16S rRNA (guanine527-N7)-methyltransferase